MKLVDDWRRVLKHAWSIRLIALVAVLNGAETALQLAGASLPIEPKALAGISFLVTVAAFAARLVAQKKMESDQ